ncbi:hypothetical protein NAEGRDRAFT_78265 [Naegleria gruberi]|uniref:Uncharacterized protein n=1 Tax=Naegleria gruberi TaxID=5762 RepID=D2V2A9_NAEGR|nr:uncharacterized protein NAEGRDRAFT_78265 [Naegleria gruberi]EFC48868.1 hypothetical protein NAEGRDRAFT_78265 [Naegleria gruberi]|eukprot:XP_002681612.1 hypothetical protein NAEGRDRAFT_78265 [Naegleria gruberi strain NEG-M]
MLNRFAKKTAQSVIQTSSNTSRSLHTNPVYDYKGAWKTYKGAKMQAFALGLVACVLGPLWVWKAEHDDIRTVYVFDGKPVFAKLRPKLYAWKSDCLDCGLFDKDCAAMCKQIQDAKKKGL